MLFRSPSVAEPEGAVVCFAGNLFPDASIIVNDSIQSNWVADSHEPSAAMMGVLGSTD